MANVVPGSYSIVVRFPGYTLRKNLTVVVPPGGCGIAHLGMFTESSISGVVHRNDGTPATGVRLDLIDFDSSFQPPRGKQDSVETNHKGEFSIAGLPSGRFLLGINIEESSRYPNRTPPTYYPGVSERQRAKVIELKANETRRGVDLVMLPPRAFRTVYVRLRWSDGNVPTRGAIDAWMSKGIFSNYTLKESGVLELKLLEGVDYWLTAAAWCPRNHWVYAANHRLTAGTGSTEITLTPRFPEPQWHKAIYPPPRRRK